MVRAVYLARTETGTQVLLWYQAPEASADASEASAAVQAAGAEGDTLEKPSLPQRKRCRRRRIIGFVITCSPRPAVQMHCWQTTSSWCLRANAGAPQPG